MRAPRIVFGLLLAVLVPATAGAQVNTEKLRTGKPDPGFHGFLEGAITLKRGNVDFLSVSSGLRLEYNTGIHEPFLQGSYTFARKSGDNIINRRFLHLRWTAMWHERIGSEVFSQIEANEFLRLQLRVLGGIGARVGIVLHPVIEVYLGTGYMIEHEALDIEPDNSHETETLNHRWTSYLTVTLDAGDLVALSSITYAQPRFDAFSDVRVLQDFVMDIKLWKHFSFLAGLTIRYDSEPPDGVEDLDISFWNKIRVSF